MKFVFLLTLWNASGSADVFVEDYGLTGEGCIARIVAYEVVNPEHTQGEPSCEIDYGE